MNETIRTSRSPDSSARIFLSVVVPVYNEASRIPATLPQVLRYLESRPETSELIVVDDGSTDNTAELVRQMGAGSAVVRLLRHETNHGKGEAVRTGVMASGGEWLLFTDADLSAPIAEAERLLEALRNGYDVAIGSRALKPEWISVHQSRFREAAGKLFNFWMRLVTGLNFRDTQCGFKAFRGSAARAIFAAQKLQGFGFDVETLFLARKFGFRTVEVPVHWAHSQDTKVSVLRDGARMFFDLLRIRWNDWTEKYPAPP